MKLSIVQFFLVFINLKFTYVFGTISEYDEKQDLHALTSEEHRLISQCEHPDYRTYIKCLKRQKRQHDITGSGRTCLDECYKMNCTTSKCMHDCYTSCKKKVIETYQRITETEINCGEHCNNRHIVPNITTNVNIKTSMFDNITDLQNLTKLLTPKIEIHNIINNDNNKDPQSDCSCPGCNCYQNPWGNNYFSPQITLGFGGGPIGTCIFPMSWPCFQYMPRSPYDCSQCANPFLRYRCDVSCYQYMNENPRNKTVTDATLIIDSSECKSPHCIGGS